MTVDRRRFGPSGLRYGDRVVIEADGVVTGARFVAGISRQRYSVVLDGTEEMVSVEGWMITEGEVDRVRFSRVLRRVP